MAKYRAKKSNSLYAAIAILLVAALLCALLTDGFKNWNKYCLFGHDYQDGVCTRCQAVQPVEEEPDEKKEEKPETTVAYKKSRLNDKTPGATASGVSAVSDDGVMPLSLNSIRFINNAQSSQKISFSYNGYCDFLTGKVDIKLGGQTKFSKNAIEEIDLAPLYTNGTLSYGTTYDVWINFEAMANQEQDIMGQIVTIPTTVDRDEGIVGSFSVAPPTYTYTVRFNANGGSGSMSTQTMTSGQSANLYNNAFTRAHCIFKGWATSANGGVVYSNGQSVTNLASSQGATVNLYAVWERSEYVVTFLVDGKTVSTQVVAKNANVPLPANPTKTGYTFLGWTENTILLNGIYRGEPVAEDTTIYAEFAANTYTIKFHGNGAMEGGAFDMDDQQMTYDQSAELELNCFLKENASFLGWATTPTGEVVYQNGHNVKNLTAEQNGVVNLYAVWEQDAYTVTLDVDGAKTVLTVANNAAVIFPNEPTKDGFDFVGWFYNDGTKYTDQPITRNTTLTARFEVKKFTVTFLVDGSEYSTQKVEINTAATLPESPTKNGYDFLGWFYLLQDDVQYTDQSITEDTFVIAVFIKIHTVTLYADGKVYSTLIVKDNEPVQLPENPTKEDYIFAGWFLPNGTRYTNQPITEDTDLIGEFYVPVKSTLTLIVDGKVYKTIIVSADEPVQLPENPVKTNYIFAGWYYGDGTKYIDQSITRDTTLTARFTVEKCVITFIIGEESYICECAKGSKLSEVLEEQVDLTKYEVDGEYSPDFVITEDITITLQIKEQQPGSSGGENGNDSNIFDTKTIATIVICCLPVVVLLGVLISFGAKKRR